MLTWTSPARGRSKPSARTPGKPPPRSRTIAAIARATSTSSVRRLTLNATSGRRAPTSTAPAAGSSRGGPKSGASSPASIRAWSSSGPPRRKNAGPRSGTAVEEHRQARARRRGPPTSRAAACARSMSSGAIGTSGTTSAAPMRGCAPSCRRRSIRSRAHPTPATQPVDQLRLRADEREDGAVVVRVGVDVQQPGARARQSRADRVDRPAVASFGEVRHRLERQHVTYPRPR